jgi:hypothetical protein
LSITVKKTGPFHGEEKVPISWTVSELITYPVPLTVFVKTYYLRVVQD